MDPFGHLTDNRTCVGISISLSAVFILAVPVPFEGSLSDKCGVYKKWSALYTPAQLFGWSVAI